MIERAFKAKSLWLVVPPAIMSLCDAGITLYGQSSEYWTGNYSVVSEGSPSFASYLAIHPACFFAMALVWVALFSTIVLLLPETYALCASTSVLLGHMWGVDSWLPYYQLSMALMLFTSVLIVIGFKRGQSGDGSAGIDLTVLGLPAWFRWGAILVLLTVPIWWFLIPH